MVELDPSRSDDYSRVVGKERVIRELALTFDLLKKRLLRLSPDARPGRELLVDDAVIDLGHRRRFAGFVLSVPPHDNRKDELGCSVDNLVRDGLWR